MSYQDKLKNRKWQRKRLEVFQAADWKCSECGSEDDAVELHVHHPRYIPRREPWEYDDLKSLCADCHAKAHDTIPEIDKIARRVNGLVSSGNKCRFTMRERLFGYDQTEGYWPNCSPKCKCNSCLPFFIDLWNSQYERWKNPPPPPAPPTEEGLKRPTPTEFWLIKLLLICQQPSAVNFFKECGSLEWFKKDSSRSIVEKILSAKDFQSALDISDEWEKSILIEAATEQRPTPNKEQQLRDIVLKLRNQYIDRQMATTQQKFLNSELTEAQNSELLNQQQAWRQMKKQPLAGSGETSLSA